MITIEQLTELCALWYDNGIDQISEVNKSVISEIRSDIMDKYKTVQENNKIEFLSEGECYQLYGFNINSFSAVVDFYRRYHLVISTSHVNSTIFPGAYTLMSRAIHDLIHIDNNYKFDFLGEYQAYKEQYKDLSFEAHQIGFSDIVLQASFKLHFGEFASNQKVVLVPEWFMSYCNAVVKFHLNLK